MTSLRNVSAAAALIGLTMLPVQGFAKLTTPAYDCGSACTFHFDIGYRVRQQPEIKVAPNCGIICSRQFFRRG